jgi:subtilisin family serine protease
VSRWSALFALLLVVAALVAEAAFPGGAVAANNNNNNNNNQHRRDNGRDSGRDKARHDDRDRQNQDRPQAVLVALADGTGDPAAVAADLAGELGVEVAEVFPESGVIALAAPAGDLARLDADRRVTAVEPERRVIAHAATELTRGADRIGADRQADGELEARPGNPVAVLDTGIARVADLNVAGGHNCVGPDKAAWEDRNGHGTHVAGTIGALANGEGVAGVAPGTPLWAVRVLGDDGAGTTRSLACGLEWVLANAKAKKIAVVNLSLGFKAPRESRSDCGSSAVHAAICKLTKAGVKVVVSAGNDGGNVADYAPAKFNQVTTVAALADSDGCAGGAGRSTSYGADDDLASFSNQGSAVDVAAPGVNVVSVGLDGGTSAMSGTSMAAPHVAAALALGWKRDKVEVAGGDGAAFRVVQLSGNTGCRG